jgi:ectoine hydroxylase-related dioxygenase (phytanoyl-CoA dioxygenase family)
MARLARAGEKGSADMFYGDVAFAPVGGPADVANPHRVGYVNDLHLHQAALAPTLAMPRLLHCLTELLGPDIDAWQVATVVKSPQLRWAGGGYSWHQDIADYGGSGDTDGAGTDFTYHGMTNFGNVCAITYLSDCAPDHGGTSVIPRSHRTAAGAEGPVRRPLFTSGATAGLWNGPYRTVEGIDALEAGAVTPTVAAGSVLLFDSWLLHRANINLSAESKIGLVNVFCRPDTLPAAGPRAGGEGTLGLALVRAGRLVEPVAGGGDVEVRRGWGDRRGKAKM